MAPWPPGPQFESGQNFQPFQKLDRTGRQLDNPGMIGKEMAKGANDRFKIWAFRACRYRLLRLREPGGLDSEQL